MSHILGVIQFIDIYYISTCVTILNTKNYLIYKNIFLKFYVKIMHKKNINSMWTHTSNITNSYIHNYSYIHYFYTEFTTSSKMFLSPIHTILKTPHIGNIHTNTSHRNNKNVHTDIYINDQKTFFTIFKTTNKIVSHSEQS